MFMYIFLTFTITLCIKGLLEVANNVLPKADLFQEQLSFFLEVNSCIHFSIISQKLLSPPMGIS